jgi:site-specific DNA-methyltransferase (cytosine-N4-specific)
MSAPSARKPKTQNGVHPAPTPKRTARNGAHANRVTTIVAEDALALWNPPPMSRLLRAPGAAYETAWGAAYLGDSLSILRLLPDKSIDLVFTSPPYALEFKKEYGNVSKTAYVSWLKPFGIEIRRVLKDSGSFVLNIGGSYNQGTPTRSLYHFKVLLMLCEEVGFSLAQECFWHNPAKLPAPAEWVNVRRQRIKDAVEYIWWLGKTDWPHANNARVLTEYSADMKRLLKRGYRPKLRPSGHNITDGFVDRGGAIPSNLIERGNNESNSDYIRACQRAGHKPHPARFPRALPEFFIKFLTNEADIVLDPFAGSNMTGATAESLRRRWLSVEIKREYVRASRVRFSDFRNDTVDD